MARGMPSWAALIGLLAVAGYQNRDKISEWLDDARKSAPSGADGQEAADRDGSLLSEVGAILTSDDPAGNLSRAIGDLVDRFRASGEADTADSWVSDSPNMSVNHLQLERAIGVDTLAELELKTGLSREELLDRLSRDLPQAVDHMTPHGHVPTAEEARQFI